MPARHAAPSPRTLRRTSGLVATMALAFALLGLVVVAAPAGAKSAPVKLDGKVNNKGTGKIKNGSVTIEADDFSFAKTFLKGRGDVTVEIDNEGSAPHTFTIDDEDIDEVIQPGQSASVTLSLTAGQPVNFYCKFHRGSGMQGAFFTGKGGTATKSGGTKSNRDSGGGTYGY